MIIFTENEKDLVEINGKIVTSFVVNYLGQKVRYHLRKTPMGTTYYASDDVHTAAKLLARQAKDIFMKAQLHAGLVPVEEGGRTAEGFLPTGTSLP
jgi:predicted SprT family Zn-dependent metalloprotease